MDSSSKPRLCVAALLPFTRGKPDWKSFERMLAWMSNCADYYGIELVFVLNADTGYVFNLSKELYQEVIFRFRSLYPNRKFICGVTAVEASPFDFRASCYHAHLEISQTFEPCEVMIMTSQALDALSPERRRDAYYEIAENIVVPALVHCRHETVSHKIPPSVSLIISFQIQLSPSRNSLIFMRLVQL